MEISTDDDCLGFDTTHPWSEQFKVLRYKDGCFSVFPHDFFQNWLGEKSDVGILYLGKCSGFGVGSIVKYDAACQHLRVGRFVAGGLRLKFLLNGQHDMGTISMSMFAIYGQELRNTPPPQYGDSIIRNDVWVGDETMMLGGGDIENGCVIGARSLLPPNFKSEPYGIYAGSPARLIRFRFSERVRESLLRLAWWDLPLPLAWVRENNVDFLADLNTDESKSLDILERLIERKQAWIQKHFA